LAVGLTAFGIEETAETLFRSMEKKVRDAKGLKLVCEVEGRLFAGGQRVKIKASQQFTGSNKARFELSSETIETLFVSDGTQMVKREKGRLEKPMPADAKLNEGLTATIARGGFMLPRLVVPGEAGKFNADKILLISGFKLGAKERNGADEAQPVEYSVSFGESAIGPSEIVRVIVWINPKTLVPLKRKVHWGTGQADFFTEEYKDFVIDPMLDAQVFELPK
jgi:hypothetical protein